MENDAHAVVVVLAFLLVAQNLLFPNVNATAMAPVGHVAGMASALLMFVTGLGGALLGSVVAGAYDGTARPFLVGMFAMSAGAAALIMLTGRLDRR